MQPRQSADLTPPANSRAKASLSNFRIVSARGVGARSVRNPPSRSDIVRYSMLLQIPPRRRPDRSAVSPDRYSAPAPSSLKRRHDRSRDGHRASQGEGFASKPRQAFRGLFLFRSNASVREHSGPVALAAGQPHDQPFLRHVGRSASAELVCRVLRPCVSVPGSAAVARHLPLADSARDVPAYRTLRDAARPKGTHPCRTTVRTVQKHGCSLVFRKMQHPRLALSLFRRVVGHFPASQTPTWTAVTSAAEAHAEVKWLPACFDPLGVAAFGITHFPPHCRTGCSNINVPAAVLRCGVLPDPARRVAFNMALVRR